MKKCSYCGKEYPEGTVYCAIDQYPLDGTELEPISAVDKSPSAGFGIRFLARIIDGIFGGILSAMAGVLIVILMTFLSASGMIAPAWEGRVQDAGLALFLFGFVGDLGYHFFCEGIHGATLGKLCCGICVVTRDMKPSRLKGALIRSLAFLVDGQCFGLIGFSSMLGSPLNQRYGDVWGKTVVVKIKELDPESRRSSARFVIGLLAGAGFYLFIWAGITILQVCR